MTAREDGLARDPAAGGHLILRSLPLSGWLHVVTVALTRHPGNPASAQGTDASSA
ncbi:hypothetical protein [Streptomyces sp. NBC_01518]|uniref:hypothetical protein n=1 Tax=Streptomyces sp. NBC_01518 TaxID=2903891 RepID=UPI00386937F0